MKLHRFIGNFDLTKKEVEIENPENIKQIKDVLRLGQGDKIILSDGRGKDAEADIEFISKNKIVVSINGVKIDEKPKKAVNLYLAILKKENFELAVQKAVECGVSTITPIITERTVKTGLNLERLKKIILEASEQSGRSIMPSLSPILNFENALAFGSASEEKMIFHLGTEPYQPNKGARSASIFIGPEGGFTETEIGIAEKAGYASASLGPLTLRGETAAIVATYRVVFGI